MIELEIYYLDEQAIQLQELGIATSHEDITTKKVTFFAIANISPYTVDGQECTAIQSGGQAYICVLPYEDLRTILHNHYFRDKK